MPPVHAVSHPDALTAVRPAAARLAPVWVELPTPLPRLRGFASDVQELEGGPALLVSPIAAGRAAGLDATPVRVRSADPEAPFLLRAPGAIRLDHRRLAFPLTGARLEVPRARLEPRRGAEGEPLMLVLPGGVSGFDAHLFPILDLGRRHCAVDTVEPLEPGATFDPVQVVGPRRRLRTASATVQSVVPWVSHRGEVRFRCQLAFGANGTAPADSVEDLVADARRTRRVLELAAMVERDAWVGNGTGPRQPARLLTSEGRHLVLRLTGAIRRNPGPAAIRFGFELFGVSYEGDARVLERRGDEIDIAWPLVLRRQRRRRTPRVPVPPDEGVALEFTNPATTLRVTRRVLDASSGGLCFGAVDAEDLLWADLPLEDAVLRWRGRALALGDMVVRSLDRTPGALRSCHAEMTASVRHADDALLVDLLATLGHPALRVHRGDGYADVLRTYDDAGLLGEFMRRNLRPVERAAATHWRDAHRAATPIIRTLMHPADGTVDATLSALRAWDRTWLIQHFGAISADGFRWSGELQAAMLDWIIPRPDGDFLLFFVHAGNPRMNAFYDRFVDLSGTPEATTRHGVSLWTLPAGAPGDGAGRAPRERRVSLGPVEPDGAVLVARAAEAVFGAMVARAFSFQADALELPDCRRRFGLAGLERARTAEWVAVDGRPRLALLHESMSVGLNLTWMQQATWLLPVGCDALDPAALPAAFAALRARPAPSPEGDRFALVPHGIDGAPLAADGWRHLLDAHVYVLNRPGVHRFHHYVADRYGEVGVRKERRASRRVLRAAAGSRDDAAEGDE